MRRACLAVAAAAATATLAAPQVPSAPRLRSIEAHLSVHGCALSVAEKYSFSSWPGRERFARDLPYAADRLSSVAIAVPGAREYVPEVVPLADHLWRTRLESRITFPEPEQSSAPVALPSTDSAVFRINYTVAAAVGALPRPCSAALAGASVFSWAPQTWTGSGADVVTVVVTDADRSAVAPALELIGGAGMEIHRVGRAAGGGLQVQTRNVRSHELRTYAVYLMAMGAKVGAACSGMEAVCYETEASKVERRKKSKSSYNGAKIGSSKGSSENLSTSSLRTSESGGFHSWEEVSPFLKYFIMPIVGLWMLWFWVLHPCHAAFRPREEGDDVGTEGWGWNGWKAVKQSNFIIRNLRKNKGASGIREHVGGGDCAEDGGGDADFA